jgi:hypothetical protein
MFQFNAKAAFAVGVINAAMFNFIFPIAEILPLAGELIYQPDLGLARMAALKFVLQPKIGIGFKNSGYRRNS